MATGRYNFFFYLRLVVLLVLLTLAVLAWRFVRDLGGPTRIIPELVRVHTEREAASNAATSRRIQDALADLKRWDILSDGAKIDAARALAEEGLARKKSYVESGLSVSYGQIGAQVRIANMDNSDLYTAAPLLALALRNKNERVRLEASYALSHLQLYKRHAEYVHYLRRALEKEYSVAIKTYLVRTLGDIGPPAATATDAIAALLVEDEPKLVAGAAAALARIGPAAYARAIEARLIQLLLDADPLLRESSAEALGAIGAYSVAAEAGLRAALNDDDVHVRVAAGLGLADLGLHDAPIVDALGTAYALAPRTTIYVEDVARVAQVRRRVTEVYARLGQAPDALVPMLLTMARETGDIEHKESVVAMIANTDRFSPLRVEALLELLQDPKFGFYYTAVDGLVSMGPKVAPYIEPLLTHERPQVRELAQEVQRKLRPRELKAAPAADPGLIDEFERASDTYTRQEIAAKMAKTGDEALLDYLLANAEVRVLNGRLYDVVVDRLVTDLVQYKFSPTHDMNAKRLALKSLRHLGVLDDAQHDALIVEFTDPGVGDRVKAIWYAQKRARPRPPTQAEILRKLYAGLETARNEEVANYVTMLLSTDVPKRLDAVKGLQRIAGHAVEAPGVLARAVDDPNQRVRAKALMAFVEGGLVTNDALAMLEAVLFRTDQSDRMNWRAARGLAQIGKPALATLQAAARNEAVAVRRAATYGLWQMGADASAALPLLRELAQDPHKGVRTYAQKALDGLESAS